MDDHQRLLDELLRQEDELQFRSFGSDDTPRPELLLVERARAGRKPLTVDIRRSGQQLFHAALPGTSADKDAWVERKANVVNRYAHSSYLVDTRFRAKGTTFEDSSRLDPNR
jgi:uncharacterized protein (UPF0303 family)